VLGKVVNEMKKIYNITISGLCEIIWNGKGQNRLEDGKTICYSDHEDLQYEHTPIRF
jgi:hypothetical protein